VVGISIDGRRKFHDKYRRTRGRGATFEDVMRGISLLNRHGVEWNALAVVNDFNVGHPLEFYRFFKEIGCRYLQFTPIVERVAHRDGSAMLVAPDYDGDAVLTEFSVTPGRWGDFLCTIFDEWVHHDVGEVYVQLFEAVLANWVGVSPGLCTMARTCGHAGVMEHNGDVYSCDHFVFPEYRLGNIRESTVVELMYSDRQRRFGLDKSAALPRYCLDCRYLFACNGECPKNRFAFSPDGEPGLNYLCEGYRRFFEFAAPYMDFMKKQLAAQQPPADVMYARF
ncbi:MAG: SPASM domain-containing protein, partial [Muribaculaceae bacterium]|nr:SPASM domain-containing protein [Muribaculaceae bacterium]